MKNHKGNFKSIGKLIIPLVKKHGEINIISYSKLVGIWETVLGEDIAKKVRPIKIKPIKGGQKNILDLGLTGPYMAEISLQIQDIIEKINFYYGKEVIVQITLQRLHNVNRVNVVELESSDDFRTTKNEKLSDPKLYAVPLENELKKLKNNLDNSRKKNEIM